MMLHGTLISPVRSAGGDASGASRQEYWALNPRWTGKIGVRRDSRSSVWSRYGGLGMEVLAYVSATESGCLHGSGFWKWISRNVAGRVKCLRLAS